MPTESTNDAYASVKRNITALADNVFPLGNALFEKLPSQKDRKDKSAIRKHNDALVCHSIRVNKLEESFTDQIFNVAKEITTLSKTGWEEENSLIDLWHQLALVVTNFSEHPLGKRVASLLINQDGCLLSFSSNRVPEGIPKRRANYIEGKRKSFILCSEPMVFARHLGIKVDPDQFKKLSKKDRHIAIKTAVKDISSAILTLGTTDTVLRSSFLLTTVPPCESCAHTIAPLKLRGLITGAEGGMHFTRAAGIVNARKHLLKHKVPIILLPKPTFI